MLFVQYMCVQIGAFGKVFRGILKSKEMHTENEREIAIKTIKSKCHAAAHLHIKFVQTSAQKMK